MLEGEDGKELRAYTIGHSSRSLEEFIKLLREYSIGVVVDVRRFPTSSRFPHFSREVLERELAIRGLKYYWLGGKLGGFRKGGYLKYMRTKEFKEGIEELLAVIDGSLKEGVDVAIMCSERLWFKCHRRFLADELVSRGVRVLHIIDSGKVYEHKRKPNTTGANTIVRGGGR